MCNFDIYFFLIEPIVDVVLNFCSINTKETKQISMASPTDYENTPENLYSVKLRSADAFWLLEDKSIVIREKDRNFALTRNGVVLTPCSFFAHGTGVECTFLKCSCAHAKNEYSILSDSLPMFEMEKNLRDFAALRQKNACIHVRTVMNPIFYIKDDLTYEAFVSNHQEFDIPMLDGPVAHLSDRPRLIAVHDQITWSVLSSFGAKSGLSCASAQCTDVQSRCTHMERYQVICEDLGEDPQLFAACSDEPINNVRSQEPIPFPLSTELQKKCRDIAMGMDYLPSEIHPEPERLRGTCGCPEKHPWMDEVCIGTAKILTASALVDKTVENGEVKDISVYVGVTKKCKCRLSADGQALTLLNVDNKHFIAYPLLLLFLSILVHGAPSFNLFSNMLVDVYHWSIDEKLRLGLVKNIVRPGT